MAASTSVSVAKRQPHSDSERRAFHHGSMSEKSGGILRWKNEVSGWVLHPKYQEITRPKQIHHCINAHKGLRQPLLNLWQKVYLPNHFFQE
jgi:hypothetical protein